MRYLIFILLLIPTLLFSQAYVKARTIGPSSDSSNLSVTNFAGTYITPPSGTLFHLVSSGISSNPAITIDAYRAGVLGAFFRGRAASGTFDVPAFATTNMTLVGMGGDGYGTSAFTGGSVGAISIKAEADFTNSSKPTYINFLTAPVGSTSVTERMRIKSNGTVNIASLNTAGFVQTNSSGDLSTAALTSGNITSALGFTPYNATNPNGYISAVPAQTFASLTGKPTTISGYGITDAYPLIGNPSSFLTSNQSITLSGDISGSGTTAITGTLATVNSNVGTFGSSTQSSTFTVNAKGLITAASNTTITPAIGSITGLGANVAAWLATPSSSNLISAITDETGSGSLVFANTPTLITPNIGAATGTSLTTTGFIGSTGTAGIGYGAGAGGSVVQATSKSTGVTINKICGQITMNNAALVAAGEISFVMTNSTISANDVVVVSIKSGATLSAYMIDVTATAAGSCTITLSNVSIGVLSEAIVLNFAVIKSVIN